MAGLLFPQPQVHQASYNHGVEAIPDSRFSCDRLLPPLLLRLCFLAKQTQGVPSGVPHQPFSFRC